MAALNWIIIDWLKCCRVSKDNYGCSSVAKFSKWLLYAKRMNYRCLGNDFFMFNKRFSYSVNDFYMFSKWFPLSENGFYMFNKWLLYSEFNFYIQQEIYIFSNLKFVFSKIRFMFNSLIYAFNKTKFNKLKSFTFSKPNLDITKYAFKSIRQNEISSLLILHPVCKYFLAHSELSLNITEMMFKDEFLFLCTIILVNERMLRIGMGVGPGHMHADVCCMMSH